MHLSRETLIIWAAGRIGTHLIQLGEHDSMASSQIGQIIQGPALVNLVVFRDYDWVAWELHPETVQSIARVTSPVHGDLHEDLELRQRAEENRYADGWSSR